MKTQKNDCDIQYIYSTERFLVSIQCKKLQGEPIHKIYCHEAGHTVTTICKGAAHRMNLLGWP